MNDKCQMCLKPDQELQLSHIIPKFVSQYLKDTSATGFLRSSVSPDKRMQDGFKKHLFCRKCEDILSRLERKFSVHFFYPYVNKILDSECSIKLNAPTIPYEAWLAKFIVSIQWRICFLLEDDFLVHTEEQQQKISIFREYGRSLLLNENDNSELYDNHIIPLQNVGNAIGELQQGTHPKLNFYLLRSIDMAIASSPNGNMLLYSKLGPIALVTALHPERLEDLINTKIYSKGEFNFKTQVGHRDLGTFILYKRPNETMNSVFSEKSIESMTKTFLKDLPRASMSKSHVAFKADQKTRDKIKK